MMGHWLLYASALAALHTEKLLIIGRMQAGAPRGSNVPGGPHIRGHPNLKAGKW